MTIYGETALEREPGFDSELAIRAVGPTTWALLSPLVWTGSQGDTYIVPVGFQTDFATVPRILHWFALPYGAYTRAAVLHDWLLTELAAWSQRPAEPLVSGSRVLSMAGDEPPANSRDTDGIFRRVMRDLGVPWSKRWVMWTAVRWASLFNPRRKYGRQIGRDLPAMLAMSVLSLPVILPGVIGVAVSLTIVTIINLFQRTPGRPGAANRADRTDDA